MTASHRARPTVTVILPCLDEAEAIGACVEEAFEGLRIAGLRGEVLVVDNGSTDGSPLLAQRHGARVIYEETKGYGSAVSAGLADARGSVIVTADADGTYDLTRLGELVGPVLEGEADLVMGSRLGGLRRGPMPFLHRYVGTPALSLLLRRTGGEIPVRDSQSGFRAFRAERMRELGLQTPGFEFCSEMLLRAGQADWRITEVYVGYRSRVGHSKLSTFPDGWKHLRVILLLSPRLLLVWPGLLAVAIGVGLTGYSIAVPEGIDLGSLRWQPVFFMSILLVLGSFAILAGSTVSRYSPLSRPRRAEPSPSEDRLPAVWRKSGVILSILGLAIDSVLFGVWVSGSDVPDGALALAGFAQSTLIVGMTFVGFDLCHDLVVRRIGYTAAAAARRHPGRAFDVSTGLVDVDDVAGSAGA